MKVSVIHPSYGRPELAFQMAYKWLGSAKYKFEYIMCLSEQDNINAYWKEREDLPVRIEYCMEANMVVQMNHAAVNATGDIIVAISDDFDCPLHWDELLRKYLEDKEDFVARIDDGIKHSGINSKGIIPMPIVDRIYFERMPWIYHPEYNHFYGDEELCRVATMLGKKIELPIVFEHIHHVVGKAKKDYVNIKNSKFHAKDKETFLRREAKGFDLVTLSLLIPTLKNREHKLNQLIDELQNQIEYLQAENVVQLIKFTDQGERTIGEKRNHLIHAAKGDYVAFIDDDDMVPTNYIQLLLSAIQDKPDCCSLNGILSVPGRQPKLFKHSIKYNGWYEEKGILYRFPNHLNCVKTSIAKQIIFPDISYAEDKKYSELLQSSGLLKKEAVIEDTLYYYNYTPKHGNIRKV